MRELELPEVMLVAGGYQEGVDGPSGTPWSPGGQSDDGYWIQGGSPEVLALDFNRDGIWDRGVDGAWNYDSSFVRGFLDAYIAGLEGRVTVGEVRLGDSEERIDFYRDSANHEALQNYIHQCASSWGAVLGIAIPDVTGGAFYSWLCSNDGNAVEFREQYGINTSPPVQPGQ